jgi:hypothetical protein
MWHRFGLVVCLLLVPQVARAQQAPDRLLSANTQLYLRWDGVEAHRAAYEASALGKTLHGDTGKFLVGLLQYTRDQLLPLLADRVDPQILQKIGEDGASFVEVLGKHGFVLGVEVSKGEPVQAQATVIFPKAGAPPAPFVALVRSLIALGNVEIKDLKIDGRDVRHLDGNVIHAVWWNDGDDAIFAVSTDQPAAILKRVHGKGPRLAANPLYKQLKNFKEFPTWGRGYIDTAALVKVARDYGPEVGQLVDDLGLDGLKSITFQSGFDGPAERGVLELHAPGERKGLLQVLNRKTFKLADLPPLPADLVSFSATNLDLSVSFDALLQGADSVARLVDPNLAGVIPGGLNQVEGFLGVKIREDFLGSFGDRVIFYDSPADGPLAFGQVMLIKTKDGAKVGKALEDLVKAIPNIPGLDYEMQQKTYRGVPTHQLRVSAPGFFYTPTYAIYKGWFVFSYYPQPVQGFILGAQGEVRTWKPGADVQKTLDRFPGEFVGLSVADPRPRLKLVLSLLPAAASLLNGFVPQARFDVSIIPNAHEVTRHLFPNVTVTTDDGKKVRTDSRASLALPF